MGFAWVASLLLFSWVSFKLGRKYQDFTDIMLARRITKLVNQRQQLQKEQKMWEEEEAQLMENPQGIRAIRVRRRKEIKP